MSTFFTVLMLIFVVFLIWGLVSPKSLSKNSEKPLTRKDALIGFGIIVLVLAILSGVTAPKEKDVTVKNASDVLSKSVEKKPVVSKRQVVETQEIPFQKVTVNDASLTEGTTRAVIRGVNGVKTLTYEITLTDGEQTDKHLIKEEVTKKPVNEVIAKGTKPKPAPQSSSSCDPNYAGACVPIASDVDCGSGSGNGPAYVYGTVRIIGSDIYSLDRDGDGYGCE